MALWPGNGAYTSKETLEELGSSVPLPEQRKQEVGRKGRSQRGSCKNIEPTSKCHALQRPDVTSGAHCSIFLNRFKEPFTNCRSFASTRFSKHIAKTEPTFSMV